MEASDQMEAPFNSPDPERARTRRQYAALFRIAERHAGTESRRGRHLHPTVLDPTDAVRLVTALAAGAAPLESDEPRVDDADLTAALTLLPQVRADLDATEIGLINLARSRGFTWQAIAFGLGLGTPQAARQRFERLAERLRSEHPDS